MLPLAGQDLPFNISPAAFYDLLRISMPVDYFTRSFVRSFVDFAFFQHINDEQWALFVPTLHGSFAFVSPAKTSRRIIVDFCLL